MQIVPWPLLIVNLRILGLIWRRTLSHILFRITTIILLGDTRQTTNELPDVVAKLEAWRLKMFHNFHFLQSGMAFKIAKAFLWIFDTVAREKSCPTSMLFLLTHFEPELGTAEFFPPAEFWLANSNFRCGSRMQGEPLNFTFAMDAQRENYRP